MLLAKINGTPVSKTPRHLRSDSDNEIHFHETTKVMRSDIIAGDPPSTKNATIYCYACDLPSTHTFLGRKDIANKEGVLLYQELIFGCHHCATQRVWGTECVDDLTE